VFLTFLNPHSLFPFLYDSWIYDTDNSYVRQDATHAIPKAVLFFELGCVVLALVWAVRRRCLGWRR
jgi:hypothetical protein